MNYLALNPIAFHLGAIPVHWYGIILGSGAIVGLLLAIQEGKRFNIPQDFFMDLLLIGAPSAVIVARIYYVAFKLQDYRGDWTEAFKIWHGGIAIHGALIGATLAAIIYVRYKGYSFWRIVDICAPSLLAGQMIGRWGNFMNQEAHGGPVAESFLRHTLHLPNFIVDQMNIEGIYYHPTFLYESVWNLVGIIILMVLRRQRFMRAGELFMSYLIWYSIGRFFIEGLRTDSLAFTGPDWLAGLMKALWSPMSLLFQAGNMSYGNVRIAQLIGVAIILAAIILMIWRRAAGWANERYLDPVTVRPSRAANLTENDLAGDVKDKADAAERPDTATENEVSASLPPKE